METGLWQDPHAEIGGIFVKGVSEILQQVETGLWQDPHAGSGGGGSSLKVYHRYYSKWRQVYGRIPTRGWGGGGGLR